MATHHKKALRQIIAFLTLVISIHCNNTTPPHQIGMVANLLKRDNTLYAKKDPSFNHLGNHIIAEFTGCINLNNTEQLESVLTNAAHAAQATVLSVTVHPFEPVGMTGVVVLEESHISVHTWPEYGYASIDVYTCGQMPIEKALEVLKEFFQPTNVQAITVNRGFER